MEGESHPYDRLTPECVLDAVEAADNRYLQQLRDAGVTVVTYSKEEMERKDVRVGDAVIVEKAGEIIPAVVRVLLEKRSDGSRPF